MSEFIRNSRIYDAEIGCTVSQKESEDRKRDRKGLQDPRKP